MQIRQADREQPNRLLKCDLKGVTRRDTLTERHFAPIAGRCFIGNFQRLRANSGPRHLSRNWTLDWVDETDMVSHIGEDHAED